MFLGVERPQKPSYRVCQVLVTTVLALVCKGLDVVHMCHGIKASIKGVVGETGRRRLCCRLLKCSIR